jgi:hypothetical protein
MRLRARAQRGLEPGADLLHDSLQGQVVVLRFVDDEELSRLRFGAPRRVKGDEIPPCVRRPHRQHAHSSRGGFELLRHLRRHVTVCEERLRVAGGHEVELTVVGELADRVERMPTGRASERERDFELCPLRLRGPATCQQPVRVLPGDAQLSGQICDRKALATQECLPDLSFIAHGRRW